MAEIRNDTLTFLAATRKLVFTKIQLLVTGVQYG